MPRFWSSLSMGEQLVFGGAAVLLVVGEWLLADLLDAPGVFIGAEIAAAELLLLIFVRKMRPATTWPLPYAVLLAGIATIVVVPAIGDFLATLSSLGNLNESGLDIVALLLEWLSAAAIAAGAWMVWRSDAA